MTRRLIRESDPPAGQLASPVPQYWNPNTEAFEDVLGAHGAPRAILYGPNGQPIGSSNPLPVADSALAQAVAQLATEGKLEEARALLKTISQKDFATQTTLSEVLQRLEAIEEQLETGDAKVQLKGSKTRISSAPIVGVRTITSIAAELHAGASRKVGRTLLMVHNLDPAVRVRVGPSAVSDRTGFGIEPEATLTLAIDPASDVPIYAVSEAGAVQVEVLEA